MKLASKLVCVFVIIAIVSVSVSCSLSTKLPEEYYEDLSAGRQRTTGAYVYGTTAVGVSGETLSAQAATTGQSASVTAGTAAATQAGVQSGVTAAPQAGQTAAAASDPSTWSKDTIITNFVNAVNKTKAVTDAYSCHHTEAYNVSIDEITGGSLIKSVANKLISSVVKPNDETLNFSGGTAVDFEGETVPSLLPVSGACTLPSEGAASASASGTSDSYTVDIKLVSESVDMNTKPTYNGGAIGFLDISKIDLSFMTVTSCDVDYTGSEIVAQVNSSGLVTKATYTINMVIKGSAKAAAISGDATFSGYKTEVWEMPW